MREALTSIGVRGMMVTEINGLWLAVRSHRNLPWREYAVNFVPKVKLEIVVADGMADQVVETIQTTAKTDKIGDGKIFRSRCRKRRARPDGTRTNDDAL